MGDLPDGPLTDRQRAIVDAVRGCQSLSDLVIAPLETSTDVRVATIRYGTPKEEAARIFQAGLARARHKLDELEREFHAYGPDPFMPREEPINANALKGETRHELLMAALKLATQWKCRLVRAGDRRIVIASDGGYAVDA
jgi:hypothetical protein